MTRERKAGLIRQRIDHLQARYDAAKRLSRRNEMGRLSREMISLNVQLLKIECARRRAA